MIFRKFFEKAKKSTCGICGKHSTNISEILGLCGECIITHPEHTLERIKSIHRKSREEYSLPPEPPTEPHGTRCPICANECSIAEGGRGYCNLRENKKGKLISVTGHPHIGRVSCYYDLLPTNCVGTWVCPGGTAIGYPDYSYCPGPEYGYKNLAVFYEACSFNCLFCQNWTFKKNSGNFMTPGDLAARVDAKTTCICYFGGDPAVQMTHSIEAARQAIERAKGRILRICWETNGSMNRELLKQAITIALQQGGSIKFDLKCYDENLHIALTGISNRKTLENFKYLAGYFKNRPDPPLVIASTLIIPGYIEAQEVKKIATFISRLERRIPYSLLVFHPQFYLEDLPLPTMKMASECLKAAREAGLEKVRIGNEHLLV